MNTIRRARKRPRVDSINWRTFGWLVAHEAALMVLWYRVVGTPAEHHARANLCSVPTDALKRRVRLRLNWQHDRRIIPQWTTRGLIRS